MRLLTCKGISSAHRHQLINCIKEEIGFLSVPVEIEFAETIRRRQYSSLWYGGLVASIKAHGCVFAVHAVGDVYATLYDKQDGDRELLYVKDKNNSGRFGVDILPYTAVTRAKAKVILIGQKQAVFIAIHKCDVGQRNTQRPVTIVSCLSMRGVV